MSDQSVDRNRQRRRRTRCSSAVLLGALIGSGCDRAPFSLRAEVEADLARVTTAGTHHQHGTHTHDNQRRWAWWGQSATRVGLDLPQLDGVLRVSTFGPQGRRLEVSSRDRTWTSVPLPSGWSDLQVPLPRRATGAEISISLTECGDQPCGWGDVLFGSPETSRLNLILIVVDTLRADALEVYSRANSTPTAALLAAGGVVFERAYAQAPWTLPSTASLLTSRWPSESPGWSDADQGLAPGVVPLAELMLANGYETAAFVGNALIADDNGFGRGFETFWRGLPVTTPAMDLIQRAHSWLTTHLERPFFLYLHPMDPHDPYTPPSRRVGPPKQWPGDANLAFIGTKPLPDAAAVADLRALYLEEVRYVDAALGLFLEQLPADVRERTLVVLTADHGEEFMEHGFLKHGTTLFDELIHVPLIFAGPGCEPGLRLEEVVRLVDLVPTVAELLSLDAPDEVTRSWRGVSLAKAVAGTGEVPPLPVISETAAYAPLQWSLFDGRHKVILFNRGHQLPVQFEQVDFIRDRLTRSMPPVAVYETTQEHPSDRLLTKPGGEVVDHAFQVADDYVRGALPGLWIRVVGAGAGGRLQVELSLPDHEDSRPLPFFWDSGDSIEIGDGSVHLDVADDGRPRTAVILGPSGGDASRYRLLAGPPSLPATAGRAAAAGPGISWWLEGGSAPPVGLGGDVTRERLRALGYLSE